MKIAVEDYLWSSYSVHVHVPPTHLSFTLCFSLATSLLLPDSIGIAKLQAPLQRPKDHTKATRWHATYVIE